MPCGIAAPSADLLAALSRELTLELAAAAERERQDARLLDDLMYTRGRNACQRRAEALEALARVAPELARDQWEALPVIPEGWDCDSPSDVDPVTAQRVPGPCSRGAIVRRLTLRLCAAHLATDPRAVAIRRHIMAAGPELAR